MTTTSTAPPTEPLGAQETTYLASRTGDATVAVSDIATGRTWLYHPGDAQDTASIVKVDIMATLMAQSEASGQPLSASTTALLTPMIEASDNDAATSLWAAAGAASGIGHYDTSIGMTGTAPSPCVQCTGFPWPGWGLTTTTASDQITLLRQLVHPGGSLNLADRQLALTLLENVESSEHWGVSGGIPPGVTVALKNGWVPLTDGLWQIDSIGWVEGKGRNYLIAVLTDGNPTEQYGIDTIDTLSAMVWSSFGAPAP